jgi:hypothetical protein
MSNKKPKTNPPTTKLGRNREVTQPNSPAINQIKAPTNGKRNMVFAATVKQSSSMVGVRIVRKEKRLLTSLNIQHHHFVPINEA